TEQGARLTTEDATLRRSKRLRPVCPCEPITIKSACDFRASSTISVRGWPSRRRDSLLSPFRRNFVAIVFVNSIERFLIICVACSRLPRPSYHNSAAGVVIGSTTDSTRTVDLGGHGRLATSLMAAAEYSE